MGKDLAERFPAARETFQRIDEALGADLSRIMWEGPESDLTLTHNTQPAILAHSAAVWAVVGDRLGAGLRAAAGHSLGEYSAYMAIGAISVEDAARLVRRRGQLMHEAGTRRPGAMAAVLGLPTAEVEAACRRRGAKRVLPLKVSGAFHSPLMQPAVEGLSQALAGAAFGEPRVPVVANASAAPVRSSAEARRLLAEQLTAPVRWVECMRQAAAMAEGATFVEVGPGNVLSGLLKRIVPGASSMTLGTADEIEKFLESGA
jgi:[acyl-carrier-protein] S-malonyltransferase